MRINIISNINNGGGLTRDYTILHEDLTWMKHEIHPVQFDHVTNDVNILPSDIQPADLNLFLEIIVPAAMKFAPLNYFIPNSEYYYPFWDDSLTRMDRLLVKTADALPLWTSKVGGKAFHLGFRSLDFFQPDVEKDRCFLHVGGQNLLKGTEMVVRAWVERGIPYPLTLITRHLYLRDAAKESKNIISAERVPEELYSEILNSHLFHVAPSQYEGWGHTIHEGLSTGAIMLSPLDGIPGLRIESSPGRQYNMVVLKEMTPESIAVAVEKAWQLDVTVAAELGSISRDTFDRETKNFRANLAALIGAA